jgi:Leucine-rich repeat (LRR) protein
VFKNLTGLSLKGQQLVDLTDDVISDLKHVVYLDLSDNNFRCVIWKSLSSLVLLRAIDLSNNKILSFSSEGVFSNSQNQIQSVSGHSGHTSAKQMSLSGDVTFYANQFAKSFPQLRFLNISLQETNLHANAGILNHPTLLELHMNVKIGRRIEYEYYQLSRNVPQANDMLQVLFADGSDLKLVTEELFVDIFGHLKALMTLSLARSLLDFVSPKLFANFLNLTTLILSDNLISFLPEGSFDTLSHLEHLDLSDNKITGVTQRTFSAELRSQFRLLDFQQNPLVCSCDLVNLKQWYITHNNIFNSHDGPYRCRDKLVRMTLFDFHINQQACLLSPETSSNIVLVLSLFVTSFTTLLLLFRYRWHLN